MSFDFFHVFQSFSDDVIVEKVKEFIEENPTKLDEIHKKTNSNDGDYYWGKKIFFISGTLLHFSCLWNKPEVVSYLFSKNADVTKCYSDSIWKHRFKGGKFISGTLDGLTARQIAEKNGFGNIVTLFEQYEQTSSEKLSKISNSIGEVEEKSVKKNKKKPSPNSHPVKEKPDPASKPVKKKKKLVSSPQLATYSTIKVKVLHNGKKAVLNLTVSNLSDLQEQIKDKLNIIGKFRIEYLDKDFGEFIELHEITELKDLVEIRIAPIKEKNSGITTDTTTKIHQNQGNAEVKSIPGVTSIPEAENIPTTFDNISTRVTDVSNEPSQILNPIIGLLDRPLCSFDEALQSLQKHVPGIENFSFICNMFANNMDDNKKQNLTDDEISSINLYTRESNPREHSIYFVLNKALRGQDRMTLKPFFPYLHLLLHSMCKLPKCLPGTLLWRGVPTNISSNYKKGKKIIWWGLSSCTKDMNALDTFLGKDTDRTLFSVQINSAIEISQFSAFPKEEEVLVFPCVTFEVQNVYSPNKGLWIVQLMEIFAPGKLITGFENLGM